MIAREELNRGAARPRSLIDLFEATAARSGGRTATQQKRDGRWVHTSWAELARRTPRKSTWMGGAHVGVTASSATGSDR